MSTSNESLRVNRQVDFQRPAQKLSDRGHHMSIDEAQTENLFEIQRDRSATQVVLRQAIANFFTKKHIEENRKQARKEFVLEARKS